MLTTWWVWIVAALLIGLLELMAPGYIFLGFAIGAMVTGGLLLLGLTGGSQTLVLALFAALSLVAWIAIRRVLGPRAGNVKLFDRDINDN